MTTRQKTLCEFAGVLVVGACLTQVARSKGARLGLNSAQVALLMTGAGVLVTAAKKR